MPGESSRNLQALEGGLQALGYVEGQNIIIERRYGDPKGEQLQELARELITFKPTSLSRGVRRLPWRRSRQPAQSRSLRR
jgi:hypothetical protein